MTDDVGFKQYSRNKRTQLTEESFSTGMQYTTAPITEGYSKELINFDLKDSGLSLIPRAGFRANQLLEIPTDISFQLLTGKNIIKKDKTFNVFITGTSGDTKQPDTSLFNGYMQIMTVTPTGGVSIDGSYEALFIKPEKAEIHKINISETTPIARNVGTWAFNDDYYTFVKDLEVYKLKRTSFNEDDEFFELEAVEPRALTPKEAVMWGYNMLSDNPYNFICTTAAGITLTGLMPYDDDGNLILSPVVNQTLNLKCFYAGANASYKVKWEFKDIAASTWNVLEIQTVSTSENLPFQIKTSFPTEQIMVRISVFDSAETDLDSAVAKQVLVVGFDFSKEGYGSTANISPSKYTLSTAKGMTYWKNRLVCYGVKEDSTLLFLSEVNDPSYFPYPNNVDIFEEPIIYAIPYLDNLLVFTSRKLWMLTLSEDGLTWNKKLIQANLTINSWDLHLIKIIKNMVFFRSGNYFYMVVPKATSTTGELVIAPISKQIEYLLNNFEGAVRKSIAKLYDYKKELQLIHYYNYLDYEDIHNVYVFQTDRGKYLNYMLLYNSLNRYWRAYVIESDTFIVPFVQDATRKGTFASIHPKGIVLYEFTQDTPEDLYYDKDGVLTPAKYFPNYQLIDTGHREHSTDYKKRYREVQLKLNNTSQKQLKFYTEFGIDGYARKDPSRYKVIHHTDASDPLYGYLTLERELVDPSVIPSATVLAETSTDEASWSLDASTFPEAMFWKIRIPVSGKGYAPSLTLISFNQNNYELLNISWIYRLLNSR